MRVTADVAVVGAGLLGLATALTLVDKDPTLDVVVLDRAEPAAGASGRGTGLLGPRVGPPIDRARRRFGDDTARGMYVASVDAVRQLCDLVDRWQIGCDLRVAPQRVVARTPADEKALRRQAAWYIALGLDVEYREGPGGGSSLCYRNAATLDPAALARGLAQAARAKGVRVLTQAQVSGLTRDGGRPTLRLRDGSLRARHVVYAVNAYAAELALPVGTVLPVEARAIVTEPVDAVILADLGVASGGAVIDANPLGNYYRATVDGRLVMGGGLPSPGADRFSNRLIRDRAATWKRLAGRLRALHAGLPEVKVAGRWAGRIGVTADGLPVVGRVAGQRDVWYAGGCNGHGLAMSVSHAKYLAAAICEGAQPSQPWHRDRAPRLPSGWPTRAALRAYLTWRTR